MFQLVKKSNEYSQQIDFTDDDKKNASPDSIAT